MERCSSLASLGTSRGRRRRGKRGGNDVREEWEATHRDARGSQPFLGEVVKEKGVSFVTFLVCRCF